MNCATATSLVRLYRSFDTRDLIDAKALLGELR
jgi:hypothetical protein